MSTKHFIKPLISLLFLFASCEEEQLFKADFSTDLIEGISPIIVTFSNNSIGAERYSWDFGDGAKSEEENPIHTFVFNTESDQTDFLVVLTAYDENDNIQTVSQTIRSFKPINFINPLRTSSDSLIHDYVMTSYKKPFVSGMSIATIDGNKTSTYFYGETELGNGNLPDVETTFQILSLTKIFLSTSVIHLLDSIEYPIDGGITRFLPAGLGANLRFNGTEITFRHLLNHTSGFPNIPSNLDVTFPNPYAEYDSLDLYEYIESNQLLRTPGTIPQNSEQFERFYGNMAYGLLGIILQRIYKKPLQKILEKDILNKIDLNDTFIGNIRAIENKAYPHRTIKPKDFWVFRGMEGCCGLNSTLNDMIKFAKYLLNLNIPVNSDDPLAKTFDFQYRINDFGLDVEVGLPWERYNTQSAYVFNGCSYGFTVQLSVDLENKKALILLLNNACDDEPILPLISGLRDDFHK